MNQRGVAAPCCLMCQVGHCTGLQAETHNDDSTLPNYAHVHVGCCQDMRAMLRNLAGSTCVLQFARRAAETISQHSVARNMV